MSKGDSEDMATLGKTGDKDEKVNTGGEIVDEVGSIEIKYEPIIKPCEQENENCEYFYVANNKAAKIP